MYSHAQLFSKEIKTREMQVLQNDSLYIVNFIYSDERKKEPNHCIDCFYFWVSNNSIVRNQGAYIENPLHGTCVIMNGNKVIARGEFENGLKNGIWKHWDENGNLVYTTEWKNGKKHGTKTEYKNNQIFKTSEYKDNTLHGKKITFRDDSVVSEQKYKHGILCDTHTQEEKEKKHFLSSLFSSSDKESTDTKQTEKKVRKKEEKNNTQENTPFFQSVSEKWKHFTTKCRSFFARDTKDEKEK